MPRRPRFTPPDIPAHVIQRGNNRSPTFRDHDDYHRYVALLNEARRRMSCAVHAYVLMTNHVHLLVTPSRKTALSQMMQRVGGQYARYFNDKYMRTGTLWNGRFRSSAIDSERYFFTCIRYIEMNPVRAGITRLPSEYAWSSFMGNAANAVDPILEPHALYFALGRNPAERAGAYAALFQRVEDDADVATLRRATISGVRLGSDPGV